MKETALVFKKVLAELVGTFILVVLGSMGILAVGGAMVDGAWAAANIVSIGFAFGLALLAGIWTLGHVSGAHFNPAVTLAFLLKKEISFSDAIGYWVGQFGGASVASAVIWAVSSREAVASTATTYSDFTTAVIVELILTTVFVWTILSVVARGANHAPVAIALTLVGVHLAGIPFSGASVNPARSFGPVVVGGAEGGQLGVYLVAPMAGAALAYVIHTLFPTGD